MVRPLQPILFALIVLFAATTSVAAADAQAEAYLQKVIEANQTLKQAGFKAGVQFGPLLAGQEPDAAKLKAAVQEAQQALAKVAADMQQAVPPDSAEGNALAAAHAKFMEGQQQIINGDFMQMMNMALDRNKPLAQRKTDLERGLEAVSAVEQKSLPPLVQAFVAYAQKYQIEVK